MSLTSEKLFIPNEYNKLTESDVNLLLSLIDLMLRFFVLPFETLKKSLSVNFLLCILSNRFLWTLYIFLSIKLFFTFSIKTLSSNDGKIFLKFLIW